MVCNGLNRPATQPGEPEKVREFEKKKKKRFETTFMPFQKKKKN